MNSIESKIHTVLLDLDPSLQGELEDQSIIVAEAAANYRLAEANGEIRTASNKETKCEEEAIIIDSLLQAMNTMMEHSAPRCMYSSNQYCADDELDYETVMRSLRFAGKGMGDMDVINDDDLDAFFENDRTADSLFDIEDIFEDEHNSDLFGTSRKHRSDSLSR